MSRDDSADEPIGYGRPPKFSRFKKGQSGNPKGRPRKNKLRPDPIASKEADEMLLRELAKEIPYKDGNGTGSMSMLEAVYRKQLDGAIKGSSYNQQKVINNYHDAAARVAARLEDELESKRELYEQALKLRKIQTDAWAQAAEGEEPKCPWPHPDDILFPPGLYECRVRGPMSEEDAPLFEYFRAERDALFYNYILAITSVSSPRITGVATRVAWTCWDSLVPLRWQHQTRESAEVCRLLAKPLHRLAKECDQAHEQARSLRPEYEQPIDHLGNRKVVERALRPILKKAGLGSLAQIEKGRYRDAPDG